MRLNHEYWCEPECRWQTNSINKTSINERLDSWASRLWRATGIELVFKSLDCFTVRPIFSTRPMTRIKSFSFFFFAGGGGRAVLSSNAFTIWCCIPISRPPWVIRRFKRHSCSLCSCHRIIMKFSGVITINKSDVHAKGQGQRSKVKVTDVKTQFSRFRTVTPVWIHIWQWNDAQSLMLLRRRALLFL